MSSADRAAPATVGAGAIGAKLAVASLLVLALSALVPATAAAGRGQWSVFEDHGALIQASPAERARVLEEVTALGADTLRIQVHWHEVAPAPRERSRPRFDAADPAQYPGFFPYDHLVSLARGKGMRILLTITGDAPRWATAGGRGRSFSTANYRPSPGEYGRFAGAVARRYSGRFGGLPAVHYYSIWNEPNHKQFLKPQRSAPAIYRALVDAGLPAIKSNGASGAHVLVGETAPVGRAGKVIGPTTFLRRWLCLNRRFRAIRSGGCRRFKKIRADGFAHHPYGPVERVPRKKDIINMLAIRRLAKYLDLAHRARRLPRKLPIYNTEFGLQSNPPDRSVSTSPTRQAQIINEKEEYAYRYGRLKSHSQYLLFDDRQLAGFQTGLRFRRGSKKPAYSAYRFPLVVHRRRGGVRVWGRVRPGQGRRYVRLYAGGRRSGGTIATNSRGYFGVKRRSIARYRFKAYGRDGNGTLYKLGTSRTARPIR
jgi:hypothetical protein